MARVITAPERVIEAGFMIYLGGAIDMGEAVDWQSEVIEALSDTPGITLMNPRRVQFTPEMMDEQILWELDALDNSDAVIIWFPRASKAPISFLEAGLYMNSGRLILGVEEGFYRQRNLELTSKFYGVEIFRNLNEIIEEVFRRYQSTTK